MPQTFCKYHSKNSTGSIERQGISQLCHVARHSTQEFKANGDHLILVSKSCLEEMM